MHEGGTRWCGRTDSPAATTTTASSDRVPDAGPRTRSLAQAAGRSGAAERPISHIVAWITSVPELGGRIVVDKTGLNGVSTPRGILGT